MRQWKRAGKTGTGRKEAKQDIRQVAASRYNIAMSTIIAIDTSSDIASVALMRGETVRSASSEGFSTHSLTALPMLQELLKKEGLAISDCDAVAFGCGPGSFTGIRTACGIVQGLSGSPSLQDGRLIGAVTHVFVNDPTMGYGLFIEWMLQQE